MGKITDIRIVKKELRAKFRKIRESFDPAFKKEYDSAIQRKFLSSNIYQEAKTILCFISTNLEVETRGIIKQAFLDKKTVAVPKCLNKNGKMKFFIITSFDDLEESTFSLLEPNIKKCKEIKDFSYSICILPGFAFDREGYRIGFGKGYYDRFLNKYDGIKVAICYNECIVSSLPRGRYDIAADYIVTQKYILTTQKTK